MRKAGIVITYIAVVLILVGIVGLIIGFTPRGNSAFCVEADGQIFSESGEYVLKKGENRFEVMYVGSDGKTSYGGYKLSVLPDSSNDVCLSVDGEDVKLSSIGDFSAGFDIGYDQTGFTLSYDGSPIEEILSRIAGGRPVAMDGNTDIDNTFIKLVISSSDGRAVIEIALYLGVPVTGAELDKQSMTF